MNRPENGSSMRSIANAIMKEIRGGELLRLHGMDIQEARATLGRHRLVLAGAARLPDGPAAWIGEILDEPHTRELLETMLAVASEV